MIKSCIIIARFLGDSGQFREADILFDRARILAIKGGNKHFCAEVSAVTHPPFQLIPSRSRSTVLS